MPLHHKRKVAEARWILEADRRNLEAMVGTPAEREAHEKEVLAMREQARLDAAKKSPSMSDNPAPQVQAQSVDAQAPSSKKPPTTTVEPPNRFRSVTYSGGDKVTLWGSSAYQQPVTAQ